MVMLCDTLGIVLPERVDELQWRVEVSLGEEGGHSLTADGSAKPDGQFHDNFMTIS